MNDTLDLNAERLRRLAAALEDLERWAEQSAEASTAHPEWTARHARAEHDPAVQIELALAEGAQSAFADAAARVADLRHRLALDAGAGPEGPLPRFRQALDALGAERAWCEAQHQEALAEAGPAIEPEQIHARGRAEALEAIGDELAGAIEAAPRGTA